MGVPADDHVPAECEKLHLLDRSDVNFLQASNPHQPLGSGLLPAMPAVPLWGETGEERTFEEHTKADMKTL